MGMIDQVFEIIRASVGRSGCVDKYAIIAPVPMPAEAVDGHELNGRDSKVGQFLKARFHAFVIAFKAQMRLVNDRFFPRTSLPVRMLPVVSVRVQNFAAAMHTVGLKAACRIWNRYFVPNPVEIACSGPTGRFGCEGSV